LRPLTEIAVSGCQIISYASPVQRRRLPTRIFRIGLVINTTASAYSLGWLFLASTTSCIVNINSTAVSTRLPPPLFEFNVVSAFFGPASAVDHWIRPKYWNHEDPVDLSKLKLWPFMDPEAGADAGRASFGR